MTYIYRQLSTNDIIQALSNDDNASWYKDYKSCEAMAEYLEQQAEDMGEAIELDIVAIRCEYSLMDDIAYFNNQYDKECETLDDIREYTQVIEINGSDSFIIKDF